MAENGGSSPRGRGKLDPKEIPVEIPGLIPARAGKTPRTGWAWTVTWAHPRAGGENIVASTCASPNKGSSPRGRGKRTPEYQRRCIHRLIPARAGKTTGELFSLAKIRAHPRAGGENNDVCELNYT